MKKILAGLLLAFSSVHAVPVVAQVDLETDQGFFDPGKAPYEEDDLDKAYRNNQGAKVAEQLKVTDVTVKDEIGSTHPALMSSSEAQMIDQRIAAENKRRQEAIFRTLSSHSSMVRNCIDQNKKAFQGSQITLVWMIAPSGKVLDTAIKSSDFNSQEVQACVQNSAQQLDFSAAAFQQYKKSHVEYTYRVKLKQPSKSARLPAAALRKNFRQARK